MVRVNARLEYIDGVGVRHTLDFDGSEPLWVGRRSECTIHNLDENLSREHCWVERERASGDFVIQDNASRAGTYVNGQSIDTHVLATGDVIQCASISIRFFIVGEGDDVPVVVETQDDRIAELQEQIAQARSEVESALEAKQSAEDEARRWREEEGKVKDQLIRLETRQRERDQQRSAEDDASSKLQGVITEQEASLKKARQEAQELSEDLRELQGKFDKQKSKLDKQKLELTRLRKEIDEFAPERDDLWSKLKAEKENSETLQRIVDRQEQMIDALRESAIERDKLIQELRTGG